MSLASPSRDEPLGRVRESFFRHTHTLLAKAAPGDPAQDAGRAYLRQRGFDLERLDRVPIGVLPETHGIRQTMLDDGFTPAEINASNLLADRRLAGRLVGPIRESQGKIVSFWALHPEHSGPACLYLNHDWKQQCGLVGLDVAMPAIADRREDLWVVEDTLDALLLQAYGLPHVAAVGGSFHQLTPERWQRIASLGVDRVTLLPAVQAGCQDRLIAAIDNATQAAQAPDVFLLPPDALLDEGSFSELLRSHGAEWLRQRVARVRLHALQFRAMRIAREHRPAGPWTDAARRTAMYEAVQFYKAAHFSAARQLQMFFVPTLLDELELPWNAWPPADVDWEDDEPAATNETETESTPSDACDMAENLPEQFDFQEIPLEVTAPRVEPTTVEVAVVLWMPEIEPPERAGDSETPPPEPNPAPAPIVEAPVDEAPIVEADPPVEPLQPLRQRAVPEDLGYCDFHRCRRFICLCWD